MIREVKPLYLSAGKTGGIVSRFGTDTFVGATIEPEGKRATGRTGPGRIKFDHDEVVMIPAPEAARHRREYAKAVAAGDVVVRSEADHKAWLAKQAQAGKDAVEAKQAEDARLERDKAARRMKEKPADHTAAKKGEG